MNYRHVYMKIISNAKKQRRSKNDGVYYEEHHILPKSLFPLWKSRHNSHTVLLTAREHFFCHKLLTKIYPSPQMDYALWKMINGNEGIKKIVSSRDYELIKKSFIDNLSSSMKCNTRGFKKGHTPWCKGTKGVVVPWNKGLKNPYSEETLAKMSKSQSEYAKQHPRTPEQQSLINQKIRDYKKAHPVSEETRRKLSESGKGKHSNYRHTDEAKEKIRQARLGVRLTEEEKVNYKKAARERYTGPKIVCVNTGEVFNSLAEIYDKYPNFSKAHICDVCKGKRHYSGIINGEKAVWKYVED